MYEDADYAHQRLTGTIISKDNTPIIVTQCYYNDDMKVVVGYTSLATGRGGTALLSNLSVIPIDMGNVNYHGRSISMSRKPMRRDWRQGARHQNTVTSMGHGGDARNNILRSKAMVKCVKNDYPTFKDCLDKVHNDEVVSIAFSKKFSLGNKYLEGHEDVSLVVFYKSNESVGVVEDGRVELFDKYKYLDESLKEVM